MLGSKPIMQNFIQVKSDELWQLLNDTVQHSTLNEKWHFDLWGLLKKRNATFHLNQEFWIMKFLKHFYFLLIRGISFPFVKGKQNICFYVREQHY